MSSVVPSLLLPGEKRPWTMSATFNFLRCIVHKETPDKHDAYVLCAEDVGVRYAGEFTRNRFLEIARTECIVLDIDKLVQIKKLSDMSVLKHDLVPLVSTDGYLCLKFMSWLIGSGRLSEKQNTDVTKTEFSAVFLAWIRRNVAKVGMNANSSPSYRIFSKVAVNWFGFEKCKSRAFGNKKRFECFRVPPAETLRETLAGMKANSRRASPQCAQPVRKRNVETDVRALTDVIRGLAWRHSKTKYLVPHNEFYVIDVKALFQDFRDDRFAPYVWKTEAAMKKTALKIPGCVDSKIKKTLKGDCLSRWRNPVIQRQVMDSLLRM